MILKAKSQDIISVFKGSLANNKRLLLEIKIRIWITVTKLWGSNLMNLIINFLLNSPKIFKSLVNRMNYYYNCKISFISKFLKQKNLHKNYQVKLK